MSLKVRTVCGTNVAQPERDSGEKVQGVTTITDWGRGCDSGHGEALSLDVYARRNSITVISPPTASREGGPQ